MVQNIDRSSAPAQTEPEVEPPIRVADSLRGKPHEQGFAIEFGSFARQNEVRGATPTETVRITDQIILPVATAKRLLLNLEHALASAVPMKAAVPVIDRTSTAQRAASRPAVNIPSDPAGDQAALLLRRVNEFGVPYQQERSFRMAQNALQANRFLITMNRIDLPDPGLNTILILCRELGLPGHFEPEIRHLFGMARCVHLGFESTPRGVVFKLYLEREMPTALEAGILPKGFPLYTAWKWNSNAGLSVLSRYFWFPLADRDSVERRLDRIYKDAADSGALSAIRAVLKRAAELVPVEQLQYLEVLEEDNDRYSFDLNMYASGLCLGDLQGELAALRDHFELRPGYFQALFDQIKSRAVGHIAGGVHRDGAEFVTVYYGVEGFPRLASGSLGARPIGTGMTPR